MELLKQNQFEPLSLEKQVMTLYAAISGFLNDIPVDQVRRFEKEFAAYLDAKYPDIPKNIKTKKQLDDELKKSLDAAIKAFKKAGFVQEGLRKHQYHCNGQYVDGVILGLMRSVS